MDFTCCLLTSSDETVSLNLRIVFSSNFKLLAIQARSWLFEVRRRLMVSSSLQRCLKKGERTVISNLLKMNLAKKLHSWIVLFGRQWFKVFRFQSLWNQRSTVIDGHRLWSKINEKKRLSHGLDWWKLNSLQQICTPLKHFFTWLRFWLGNSELSESQSVSRICRIRVWTWPSSSQSFKL